MFNKKNAVKDAVRSEDSGPTTADSADMLTEPAAVNQASTPNRTTTVAHPATDDRPAVIEQGALRPKPPLSSLWTDALGRVSTRSIQVLVVLIMIVIIVYAGIQLKLIVIPVLIALILASALTPLVTFFTRWMPRVLAAVVSLLIGVVVFGAIILIVVQGIQSQAGLLTQSVTDGIDQVTDLVQNGPIPVNATQLDTARDTVIDFVTSSQFGAGALAGASVAANLIAGLVLTLFTLFYFMKDGPTIWSFLMKPLHPETHARARRAGVDAVSSFGGYIRGTATVALFDAILIGIALVIFKVPLALPLAIVVFIGAFIPIVGASVAGVIAALVALVTVGLPAAIGIAIAVLVVNQLEGNVLSPIVLGRSLKLNGLVVLLALTAGTILGGIVGTLLSVPLTAAGWSMIKRWNDPIVPVAGVDIPIEEPGSRGRSVSAELSRRFR